MLEKLIKYKFKNNTGLINLTGGFFVCLLDKMFKEENESILVVTPSIYEARSLYNKCNNKNSVLFENDIIYYNEDISISPELRVERINILNDLMNGDKKIVFTDISGYLKYLPSIETMKKNKISLKVGLEFDHDLLINKLADMGYVNNSTVSGMGEFARRGFVIDIFPVNSDDPIRISFFGDEIESIKYFDSNSQKTIKNVDNFDVLPFIENLGDKKVSIYEYLNSPIVIFKDYDQINFSYEKMVSDNFDFGKGNKVFFDFNEINPSKKLYFFDIDNKVSFKLDNIIDFKIKPVPLFKESFNNINNFVNKEISSGKTIVIFLDSKNVNYILDKFNFDYTITSINNIFDNKVNIIKDKLAEGFEFNNYIFLSSHELFNKKYINPRKTRYKSSSRIKDLSKLSVGDYVVHDLHGIGIYNGIKTISKDGILSDYIEVLYAKGDKLYIPASKIEYIGKYTGKDGYKPQINALNSTIWQKTKSRIREKIKIESEKLIKIQAERELKKGFSFSPDSPMQTMFESEFQYEETLDQIKVTNEIKKDMENATPMDRILCGDVGYGKTEVAFRAMFKAVLDGKQVLYLCPTTLLSKQQYEVALERFDNYPVNIAILNRFVSPKKAQQVLDDLKNGKIDILFGTHRILSDDVICNDLGLLVVDEEQRFGVIHKEKIKEMKSTVDVLTLTATPIPRTLQMAILGIKNLSLIETPPKNRKSVVTYVTCYDEKLIRDVVYKEISRDGQVFILYNRVEDIELKVQRFKEIIPDADIRYAHGKMEKNDFENTMNDFIDGKFDVLVCTTIIETGVDIPNVNTLVVLDADRFGLSQLYQIRGRVGRSNSVAYAYLMYNKGKVLTETAIKRLKVIKDFTELGSGFAIATRDLSIRGAGDILGSEQAGFIDSVGIDLYLKMLNEEVAKLKGETVPDTDEGEQLIINNVSTHIKDSYVVDEDVKIEIHKMINSIDSYDKLKDIKLEIEDRFGKIDQDMLVYMYEQLFEEFVKKLGIVKVFDNNKYREVCFDEEKSLNINYEELFVESLKINKKFKFSYKNKLLFVKLLYSDSDSHVVFDFVKLLKELK